MKDLGEYRLRGDKRKADLPESIQALAMPPILSVE
jgi:hypothetical protein